MLWNDARTGQIICLSLFLLLGIFTRDWALQPGMIGVAIATTLLTQTLWIIYQSSQNGDWEGIYANILRSLPSALITALGLSLLLRVDHYSTMVLASAVGITSKFCLRVQDKHLFNPANFGIVTVLALTGDAWVSPGQWGEEGWYALAFLGGGGLVLQRVGRWDTSVMFLVTYAGLEAARNVWLGLTWDVWAHRLMNGSLLLFALFMVTDPRTIPNHRLGRLVWVGAIAVLTFILRNLFFIPEAMFWALFVMSPVAVAIDGLLPGDDFSWESTSRVAAPVADDPLSVQVPVNSPRFCAPQPPTLGEPSLR
ncbi:MAG: RnfABCDGE type electron transport complex subunit D [Oculatellaceae cyanobacterium Prado106]|jgi:Na+-transporting NADH:ubiquinone oxidoreductase subunit NqrB|nr:RnfABCDGE type electron transport complex subunit D [Oculatellaceae cyanobacterium Prado106]